MWSRSYHTVDEDAEGNPEDEGKHHHGAHDVVSQELSWWKSWWSESRTLPVSLKALRPSVTHQRYWCPACQWNPTTSRSRPAPASCTSPVRKGGASRDDARKDDTKTLQMDAGVMELELTPSSQKPTVHGFPLRRKRKLPSAWTNGEQVPSFLLQHILQECSVSADDDKLHRRFRCVPAQMLTTTRLLNMQRSYKNSVFFKAKIKNDFGKKK